MATPKTIETGNSVADYISAIDDENKRTDCMAIVELLNKQTGFEPKLWGTSIIGFGSYHYKYQSGHEGNAPLVGLAARANAITLYLVPEFEKKEDLLLKFGKHKTGKGCIYIQKLDDIDTDVLIQLVSSSIEHIQRIYPSRHSMKTEN